MKQCLETDMGNYRRVAAHEVILPDGKVLHQAIVEICDGSVLNYYEFQDEMPLTEWYDGHIEVRLNHEGIKQAFWVKDSGSDGNLEKLFE